MELIFLVFLVVLEFPPLSFQSLTRLHRQFLFGSDCQTLVGGTVTDFASLKDYRVEVLKACKAKSTWSLFANLNFIYFTSSS